MKHRFQQWAARVQEWLTWRWELFFLKEQALSSRILEMFLFSFFGFIVIWTLHVLTGLYFTSFTILVVIVAALRGGAILGFLVAVILSLVADYFFIPPIGSVLDSRESFEHFAVVCSNSLLGSFLMHSLRLGFRRTSLAKREAEQATQQARESAALMEKLLALVSHDIRNPLTSVKMNVQLVLRYPQDGAKQQELLSRSLDSLDRIDSMIHSLLDVSRLRAGKPLPLDFENCDLNSAVTKMVDDIRPTLKNPLTFETSGAVFGSWGIKGLRRALENLITNATKYGNPDGPITVSLITAANSTRLSVHNEGKPIPLDEQSHLFDSFHRVHNPTTDVTQGWGLGLALVKGVAEAHGGNAQVKSTPHDGTTFTLMLPIKLR